MEPHRTGGEAVSEDQKPVDAMILAGMYRSGLRETHAALEHLRAALLFMEDAGRNERAKILREAIFSVKEVVK